MKPLAVASLPSSVKALLRQAKQVAVSRGDAELDGAHVLEVLAQGSREIVQEPLARRGLRLDLERVRKRAAGPGSGDAPARPTRLPVSPSLAQALRTLQADAAGGPAALVDALLERPSARLRELLRAITRPRPYPSLRSYLRRAREIHRLRGQVTSAAAANDTRRAVELETDLQAQRATHAERARRGAVPDFWQGELTGYLRDILDLLALDQLERSGPTAGAREVRSLCKLMAASRGLRGYASIVRDVRELVSLGLVERMEAPGGILSDHVRLSDQATMALLEGLEEDPIDSRTDGVAFRAWLEGL